MGEEIRRKSGYSLINLIMTSWFPELFRKKITSGSDDSVNMKRTCRHDYRVEDLEKTKLKLVNDLVAA